MNDSSLQRVSVIDSHTGGEPTRIVVDGGPALGSGGVAERLEKLRDEHDGFRSAVVNEPRGSDVLVGGLLCRPVNPEHAAGIIFFNNVGYLGMCGHGSIGLAVTLMHLGKLGVGTHTIETPAGNVQLTLHDRNTVSVSNVPSNRYQRQVPLQVPGIGQIHGDIAWGGNWFFLVADHGQVLEYDNVAALENYTRAIQRELDVQGIRGEDGGLIDHIELFGPPSDASRADSRSFVLCPGGAYDRSPCGTGTSAKVACLVEDQVLSPGDVWRQESITGSIFEASCRVDDGQIYPTITGTAYVTSEATLILDPSDPFRHGLRVD